MTERVTMTLPSRFKRLAKTRRRIMPEKRLVPWKILHGPVIKAFDNPKVALKNDEENVTKNKVLSSPITARLIGTLSGFWKSQSRE